MAKRGGQRLRRYIVPGEVPVWVTSGRWGPRRVRVGHCWAILRAELVYDQFIRERRPLRAGWRARIEIQVSTASSQSMTPWYVDVEVRANAVWRLGRLFLRCPSCSGRVARLYVPIVGLEPRCRRCWGLCYESQSWSYKPVGLFGRLFGPIAYATTLERRQERKKAARVRYEARRALL